MGKKEIIILVIVGVIIIGLTTFITISIVNKKDSNTSKDNKKENKNVEETEIKVGNYTLKYGTYKGIEYEYDPDTEKTNEKEMVLELTKDQIKLNGSTSSYTVKDNYLYADQIMYEVTDNNKFTLQAGSGVDFEYYK